MSRPTQLTSKSKLISLIVAVLLIAGGAATDIVVHHQQPTPPTVKSAPITSLMYHGQDGKTALALLEHYAKVQTKSSSLGEYVVSINGNDGGGKKYWLFYVNGKEAQVGAGAYVTHTGDLIQWKLQ